MGLLGTFNGLKEDDLMSPDGSIIPLPSSRFPEELRRIYDDFGERC